MSELPKGWQEGLLGEIGKWGSGGTPKSIQTAYYGGSIPWVRSGDLPDGPVETHEETITEEGLANSSAKWVPSDAVLIALYGATIGKLGITSYPVTTNQAVAHCIPDTSLVSTEFLFWYLLSSRPNLIAMGQGGAQPNISQTILKEYGIPLPPLPVQRRIVAKLDSLFDHSKRTQAELARIPKLVERYKQAVLEKAFSGQLTSRWREHYSDDRTGYDLLMEIRSSRFERAIRSKERAQIERAFDAQNLLPKEEDLLAQSDLPESWTSCRIGTIGDVCNGSTPSRSLAEYWDGPIPWVSSGEVRNNVITVTRECITRAGYENSSVKLLPKGTVLLAMIGEGKTRGQSAVLGIEATINQNIAAVVIDHGMVLPEFVWRWFQLQYQQTRRRGAGNGPKALNCQAVRDLPFVLPPLSEQQEVVSKLRAAFEILEASEAQSRRAALLLDRLDQATLAKAFRGELAS